MEPDDKDLEEVAPAPGTATGPAPKPVTEGRMAPRPNDEFVRAENEDDDGYDPYSDRRPEPEPLFERDPWA